MTQDHDADCLPTITEAPLRHFLALYRTPEKLDPEVLEQVAWVLSGVLGDNKARKAFGLPVTTGRPEKPWIHARIRHYVELAQCYGHSRSHAIELACAHFDLADKRKVSKIVRSTGFIPISGDESDPTDEAAQCTALAEWTAHLEKLLREDCPPKPTSRPKRISHRAP